MKDQDFWAKLDDLLTLYLLSKKAILWAEELDSESKSNISVFKEQRDALDHVMRSSAAHLGRAEVAELDDYVSTQFSKARGHLYRAAYDAMDGLAVNLRRKFAETMRGFSNEAIAAVYKDY